jgi:hypothetical protein
MIFTYDLWYNMPGIGRLEHKISIDAPSSQEAISQARQIWDMLNAQGYYLQQRP